ncbi:MAG: flagellar basal-body rod protein FlgG [Firmicutes bacterium]|nr:flagellar basal-body rod protein FlgG [Bacillota bacterium]
MITKLWSSASGMLAQSFRIDTIANNIANVNTTGYKKVDVQFQDLLYNSIKTTGNPVELGAENAMQVGQGVKPAGSKAYFLQGVPRETGRELDLAIQGDGFFRVFHPDGQHRYTRAGNFNLDADGHVVTDDGYRVDLLPQELLQIKFTSIIVDRDGMVRLFNETGELMEEGAVEIFKFQNVEGLEAKGRNLWLSTENSGQPIAGRPGDAGFGTISQKFLEQSNVNMTEEMTRLIMAQRSFEVSSRAVRTADEMWALANQIRK